MQQAVLLIYIIALISVITTARPHFNNEDELILAQVVWRHGDRAPIKNYPRDPNDEKIWPYGWGELTERGMKQQFALGKLLRKRYIEDQKLLDTRYNPKQIYIRSTDVNRTILSAISNLAGMFPVGKPGEDFPKILEWPHGWTPVPIHTIPEHIDSVGNIFTQCPRADQLHDKIDKSSEFITVAQENRRFFQYVSEETGKAYNLTNINELNDIIYCEMVHNVSQPEWVSKSVILQLKNLTHIGCKFFYGISKPYIPELIRLRGGPMLKDLIDRMKRKIECSTFLQSDSDNCQWYNNLKYYAYSAHDTTLAALISTFGDEEAIIAGSLPHYTASLVIELWKTKEYGPTIKVLYHSASNNDYHVITDLIKGCPKLQPLCPLAIFEQRSKKYIPNDLTSECKMKRKRFSPFELESPWE